MALETLIVKSRNETFHTELRTELLKRFNGMSWYIVSTSSLKRRSLREQVGYRRVINPFRRIGEFEADLIWVEDWPSLMGERFTEFHFLLFSSCKILILGQTYRAPSWAKRKLDEFCPNRTYLSKDALPSLPLFPILPQYLRVLKWSPRVLWKKNEIYQNTEIDFFVGLYDGPQDLDQKIL